MPERLRTNVKQRQILGSQTEAAEGSCRICQHILSHLSPRCPSPGLTEVVGLAGTRVWRWGRSSPQIWAGETPPKRPGIHTDKPITSSELIMPRETQHKHPQDKKKKNKKKEVHSSSYLLLFLELFIFGTEIQSYYHTVSQCLLIFKLFKWIAWAKKQKCTLHELQCITMSEKGDK